MFGPVLVAGLIAAAMVFQVWLLWAHWINPDEGAHLMDARLASEGLVPGVDYDARQPLYTYAYVPFLELLGPSIVSGRFMPLVCTWLAGLMVFLLGCRLWDRTHGAIAALLLLCAPTILVNASVVKMEPLAVLVTVVAFFALAAHFQTGRLRWLVLTGCAFGVGYYVRESTVAGLIATTGALLCYPRPFGRTVQRISVLYGAFALVCICVLLWYARFAPWQEILPNKGLNPVYRVWKTFADIMMPQHAIAAIGAEPVPEALATVRLSAQPIAGTIVNLVAVVQLNAPLVLAAVFASLLAVKNWLQSVAQRRPLTSEFFGVALVLAWLVAFSALYTFFAIQRGFFQFYFRELIPPLVLLASWLICRVLDRFGQLRHALVWVGGSLAVLTGAFFVQRATGSGAILIGIVMTALFCGLLGRHSFRTRGRAVLFGLGSALLVVGWELMSWLWGSRDLYLWWEWVCLGLVSAGILAWLRVCAPSAVDRSRVGALLAIVGLSASAAGVSAIGARQLGPAFDSVWPRSVLTRVVELIKLHSRPEEAVISGAVIWEFEAGRQPFARLTHPLGLRDSLTRGVPPEVLEQLATNPPRLIILDGYTEQTYFRRIPAMQQLVERNYTLVEEVPGALFPVRVFAWSGVLGEGPR